MVWYVSVIVVPPRVPFRQREESEGTGKVRRDGGREEERAGGTDGRSCLPTITPSHRQSLVIQRNERVYTLTRILLTLVYIYGRIAWIHVLLVWNCTDDSTSEHIIRTKARAVLEVNFIKERELSVKVHAQHGCLSVVLEEG